VGILLSTAFVLINAKLGLQDQILKDLQKILGVDTAYSSHGVYDLIVKVQADSLDKLKELIFHHIRQIHNVQATLTLTVTEE
jgi:DNA-binding Lrp family transcriptional regulator